MRMGCTEWGPIFRRHFLFRRHCSSSLLLMSIVSQIYHWSRVQKREKKGLLGVNYEQCSKPKTKDNYSGSSSQLQFSCMWSRPSFCSAPGLPGAPTWDQLPILISFLLNGMSFGLYNFSQGQRGKKKENKYLLRTCSLARILLDAFIISFNPRRVPTKCSYHYIMLKMIKLRLGEGDPFVHIHKSFKKL